MPPKRGRRRARDEDEDEDYYDYRGGGDTTTDDDDDDGTPPSPSPPTTKRPRRKAAAAPAAERRVDARGAPVRFSQRPNAQVAARIERALPGSGHRMFLLDSRKLLPAGAPGGPSEEFIVEGTTHNGEPATWFSPMLALSLTHHHQPPRQATTAATTHNTATTTTNITHVQRTPS